MSFPVVWNLSAGGRRTPLVTPPCCLAGEPRSLSCPRCWILHLKWPQDKGKEGTDGEMTSRNNLLMREERKKKSGAWIQPKSSWCRLSCPLISVQNCCVSWTITRIEDISILFIQNAFTFLHLKIPHVPLFLRRRSSHTWWLSHVFGCEQTMRYQLQHLVLRLKTEKPTTRCWNVEDLL